MTRAVLFDIDGTLVDSNYLHVDAWVRAFAELERPVDTWRIHRSIGMDSTELVEALIGVDAGPLLDRATQLHARFYLERAARLRPFAGARPLLDALAERGAHVVLATSAPPEELEVLLDVLGFDDDAPVTTSSGDVGTAKPEPDIVRVALDRAGATSTDAVFVGDSVWDVIAAKRAGVPTVGVLTGGTSRAELLDAGAIAVADDVADLLDTLDSGSLLGVSPR